MTAWTYGVEGLAYPVQPLQLWRLEAEDTVHDFRCGSLLAMGQVATATLVYSDPPWNQGNVNAFRTKAGLDRARHSWLDIYRAIARLAGGLPLFAEGGCVQADKVQAVLPCEHARARWPITYYHRHPAVLHYAGPPLPLADFTGMDDDDTPLAALGLWPPGTVLDPCSGRGLTSRAAFLAGWHSVNVELNPHRVSAALARLARLTGRQPRLIEE